MNKYGGYKSKRYRDTVIPTFTRRIVEWDDMRGCGRVESVALESKDDIVLRPMLEEYEGLRVIVCPPEAMFQW